MTLTSKKSRFLHDFVCELCHIIHGLCTFLSLFSALRLSYKLRENMKFTYEHKHSIRAVENMFVEMQVLLAEPDQH